jgi:hypothetical protein
VVGNPTLKNKKHHGKKKESQEDNQKEVFKEKESITFFSQPLALRRAGFLLQKLAKKCILKSIKPKDFKEYNGY